MNAAREAIRRRHLPDVLLQTHQGNHALFYDDLVRDKLVLISFMYVNCEDGTCPLTTHNLTKVQRVLAQRLPGRVHLYSITLDPERDTPEALRAHARAHRAGEGWLFLRATPADTERLRRGLGFYDLDPTVDARRSSHAAMLRYGNEPRQLWGTMPGLADPAVIARAVQRIA